MSDLTSIGGGVWADGPPLPRPPEQPPEPKVPAAVVYLERPDGRVLAVPRKDEHGDPDYADYHLMGGKWDKCDGKHLVTMAEPPKMIHDLAATAIREVIEETGLHLQRSNLRAIHQYTTRSGRPVVVFVAEGVTWLPPRFQAYPGGVPAWVPTGALTLPWCRLAPEAEIILRAVADDRARRSQ